jgi:hypothetical protein
METCNTCKEILQLVNHGWATGLWEHSHDCGRLGPNTSTRACTCGLTFFYQLIDKMEKDESN